MNLDISKIDSDRFRLKIGRAFDLSDENEVAEIKKFIRSNDLDCVIARCVSTETNVIRSLENSGFRLMEGRIRFIYRRVDSKPDLPMISTSEGYLIREGVNDDQVESLVRKAYAQYKGHYHRNRAFRQTDCDDVYVDWALNALSNISAGDYFYVIEKSAKLVAFASGNKAGDGNFLGGLLGVDPNERRHGLASVLHCHRLQWCQQHRFKSLIVATSLNNWAYQNLLIKLGYEVLDSDLTFHWTNQPDTDGGFSSIETPIRRS